MLEHLAQTTPETESALNVVRVFWLFIGLALMLALGALFIRVLRRSVQRRLEGEPKRTKTEHTIDPWVESARRLRTTEQSPPPESDDLEDED